MGPQSGRVFLHGISLDDTMVIKGFLIAAFRLDFLRCLDATIALKRSEYLGMQHAGLSGAGG